MKNEKLGPLKQEKRTVLSCISMWDFFTVSSNFQVSLMTMEETGQSQLVVQIRWRSDLSSVLSLSSQSALFKVFLLWQQRLQVSTWCKNWLMGIILQLADSCRRIQSCCVLWLRCISCWRYIHHINLQMDWLCSSWKIELNMHHTSFSKNTCLLWWNVHKA